MDQKKNLLFIILTGIFVTNALMAEMIGVKIFSAEATLGFNPANFNIMGFTMAFNLTAGAVIWPVVFITTDLINEYFGKPGVKRISYFTAALIAYAFVVIFITIRLAPADFWINSTDTSGNALTSFTAGQQVYFPLSTLGIVNLPSAPVVAGPTLQAEI